MQSNKKKQVSVKDKLDDNTLDLSLMELTEVPVKDMAPLTRASIVDLSNNKLVSLPPNFASSLTFIVKLDLSKNQLQELPENFGLLRNLRHLDLFSNQLQRVPVSFCQLTQLKWLDLKNNPLVPTLAAAAGECLDTKGCQTAAKNVVKLMQMAKTELDKQQEERLKQEKAKEAARLAREAREQEKLRQEKKLEKERRKAELRAMYSQRGESSKDVQDRRSTEETKNLAQESDKADVIKPKTQGCCGKLFRWIFYLILLTVLAAGALVAYHWEGAYKVENVNPAMSRALQSANSLIIVINDKAAPITKQFEGVSKFVTDNTRDTVKAVIERTQHYGKQGWRQSRELFGHYWAVAAKEAPAYYKVLLDRISSLSDKIFGDKDAQKRT